MRFDRITQFACFCIVGLLMVPGGGARAAAGEGDLGGGVLCQDDLLGTLVDSSVLGVARGGDLMYVMVRFEGLRIYDVSDLGAPVQVGSYPVIGSMLIDGDRLIVSSGYDLQILDVSDPSAPALIGFFAGEEFLTFPLNGWALVGDVVYMASSQVGLMLFDISDPANIVQLETYGGFLSVYGVLSANSGVYVARAGELEVLDVSNPRSPTLAYTLDGVVLHQVSASSGSFMYLAGMNEFSVFDISNPAAMNLVGSVETGILRGDVQAVRVVDGRAYLSTDGSMEIIDVSDPANPVCLGTYGRFGVRGVEVFGQVAFVASEDGVAMVDVSEPGTPEVGFVVTAGVARSVVVEQGYAYIADEYLGQASGTNGLRIVDVRDPRSPTLVGSLDLVGGPTRNLVVDGSLVFSADGYFGFHVIDVSDPGSPTMLGGYDTDWDTVDLAVAGSMVYVADAFSLLVFDAGDPTSIELVAAVGMDAVAVVVFGDVLYVVEDRVGVLAFDISDPTSPTVLGSFKPADFYSQYFDYGLELDGDRLVVVGSGFGMIVLDVSDPSAMQLVDQYESPGLLEHGVFVDGGTVYVVDDRYGLQLVDLDAPGGAELIGSYRVPWGASDVDVVNGLAYVVDGGGHMGDGGLRIVNITESCSLCAADLDADGVLNFFDVSLFLSAFASMDAMGDFDGDGSFNFFDVSAFLLAFGSGCS